MNNGSGYHTGGGGAEFPLELELLFHAMCLCHIYNKLLFFRHEEYQFNDVFFKEEKVRDLQ